MKLPEVSLTPDEPLESAVQRVQRAYAAQGARLLELEQVGSSTPAAGKFRCRYFQALWGGRPVVNVVAAGTWTDDATLGVLNLLLHVRTDPDPPGASPRIKFYSAMPVPPVLLGIFGDSPASEFECRAAVAVRFGGDLAPGAALQMGAVALHLLRECLGVRTSFFDADGDLHISAALTEGFGGGRFPEEGSPLNALISLGFLYGEMLRVHSAPPSRWVQVKSLGPWPVLVFGAEGDGANKGVPQVVFNPIHTLLNAFQQGSATLLRETRSALEATLREKLGSPPEAAVAVENSPQ